MASASVVLLITLLMKYRHEKNVTPYIESTIVKTCPCCRRPTAK